MLARRTICSIAPVALGITLFRSSRSSAELEGTEGAAQHSWTRNLHFRSPSGFWADAAWYDLQMERRLPETAPVLREIVFALPPLSGALVADLGSGSGRCAQAIAEAYPQAKITLIDADEERGELALQRLRALRHSRLESRGEHHTSSAVDSQRFIHAVITPNKTLLPGRGKDGYDCVVALQSIRHMADPPPHYAAKHNLNKVTSNQDSEPGNTAVSKAGVVRKGYMSLIQTIFESLKDGGHVFIGDHVQHGHPGVFEHCEMLKSAGFCDVDVAWRLKDWFVVGARRPPLQ